MEMSGQFDSLTAFFPGGKSPRYPIKRGSVEEESTRKIRALSGVKLKIWN
jgi:hypothetical protein